MNQYQPAYSDHQNLPNVDEPMVDPSDIRNTVNFQINSGQQRSQRGRSSSRMPPHLATHQSQHSGSSNGGSSIYDPISLSSPSPDRSPRKRAASRVTIDNRSPKRQYRAGSVYGQSPADKIKMEYQNQINLRDAHMHGPGSPFRHQNGAPRTPLSAEIQSRLDELQRKKDSLIAQTMAAHEEQFNSIVAEEQQLLMQNGGSPNNSVVNGGYGSPNGIAPSPTRNGFNSALGPQLSPRAANGHVNGNHISAMNVFDHYPPGAYGIQNSSHPPQTAQQNGFPQNNQSPAQLQPAIWDSGANSPAKKNFVDSIRESAWRDKENRKPNIPNRSAARGQSVAPPTQRKMAYTRGKSLGPTIYRRVEGDSRLVNMHTGQWASSSDEDDPLPPPTAGRSQRAQTVGPNGASLGKNNIGVGIPVEGIHSRNFQQRSSTVAPSGCSQGNIFNGNHAQEEESKRFQRSRTVAPEPATPQRTADTQNGQQSSSNNFVTPPDFPQTPHGTFSLFNNSPNGKNPKAEPVTPQNKVEIPYPTSESGSLLEHLHRARLRTRGTNEQSQQYTNDIPKGGIAFRARKKEPVTPAQHHIQQDIINLISPDGSATRHPLLTEPFPEPPIIEKPIKDRIAPASKPGARKRAKSVAPEAPVDPIVEERKRQERAATIILDKERKVAEGSIFGDDPAEENKKVEERKRLLEKRKERQAAIAHEKESRELEQRKLQAAQQAKAEEAERQKTLQESKNHLRREAQRKLDEAEEAKAREQRREATQAKIEADKKKKGEAKLEAEQKRQKGKEVQVEAKLVEEQKARREALKNQVAPIKASKISSDDSSIICLGDNNTVQAGEKNQDSSKGKEKEATNDKDKPTTSGTKGIANKEIIDLEPIALFIPANVPPSHDGTEAVTAPQKVKQALLFDQSGLKDVYDIDMRTLRGKSKGPTTAAEMMALAQAKKAANAGENARDIREKQTEVRRAAAAADRLQSRMARREREKSAPQPVLSRRPEPKAARASASQPEPKQAKQPAKPRAAKGVGKSIEKKVTSALFPAYIPDNYAEPPPPVNKVTATIPKEPAAANVAERGPVLLSDEERVRLEAEQKRKEALELEKQAAEKASASEARRIERLKREAETRTARAREKKKQQLIQDAANRGVELPHVELLSQLETFMEQREVRRRKAANSKETINKIRNFDPDSLGNELEESLDLDAGPSRAKRVEDLEDVEGDSPETLERKARQRAIRETLNSMSQGRKSQQTQPIRMTCADETDSDSSDASEEDPDTPQGSDTSDSEDDDDDVIASQASHGARPSANELGTQIEEPVICAQPKKKSRKPKPVMTCPDDPENCVRVYTIMERKIVKGVIHMPYTRQIFLNYTESVVEIKKMIERLKEARPVSCEEQWHGDLTEACLIFDQEGDNILEIWLSQDFKSRDMNPADFGMNEIKELRHTEKSYFVKSTITTRTTNAETGVVREVVDVKHLSHWSDIDLANNNAMEMFIKYARPPKAIVDHFEIYDKELVPSLRKARNDLEYLKCFSVELSRGESGEGLEVLKWIPEDVITVIFGTELYHMKGPLN